MRKFVKTQQALETVDARMLGSKKKNVQKQTLVAFGDGDMTATSKIGERLEKFKRQRGIAE